MREAQVRRQGQGMDQGMDRGAAAADARGEGKEAGAMRRALVLGGGGPVGFAWESGLIAGFAQGGVDLGEADFILGTSAGSIAGARLASGIETARLAEALIDPASTLIHPPVRSPEAFMRMMNLVAAGQGDTRNPAEIRREVGALALSSETASEEEFVDVIGRELGELPSWTWPGRDYACTAVDAQDGGFQLWQASSGVDLRRAVTSSCSVPGLLPPITLQGRRYMDGGIRSATNADLAAGYDVVVVVAVAPPGAARQVATLNEEIESLQGGGSTVIAITPDDASSASFGPNLMDAARKPDAARAGVAQALSQAAIVKDYWG
jgi:NTE family protein